MSIIPHQPSLFNDPPPPAPASGEQLKAESLDLLADRRSEIVTRARRAMINVLLECGEATIDDVRVLVEIPPGIDPKLFGSVPGELAKKGIVRAAGYIKSNRPEAHARPVTVWKLANRIAALAWLAAHPVMEGGES